ncbi:MAG TPA: biosynthetic peptidoglycan transglycosylase [Spirochaetia bacterium]|nr:biosynthetic peptidoglycan transglycosylase [Spirochaetia bacterium]
MAFAPLSILPRDTSQRVEEHTAWHGRGIRAVGFIASRSFGALWAGIGLAHLVIFLVALFAGLLYSVVNPPITSLMIERHIAYHVRIHLVRFIPLSQIPKSVQTMFVRVENRTFYTNPGIDIAAIKYAWELDRRLGYWALGGSTITQQLTRSLLLSTNKSFGRKYVEALMSLTINLVMSKQRQLELYLNYIEWGKGIFGIQTAAYAQYGKPLSQLTTDQIIRLAVIISSPWRYNVNDFFSNKGMVERYHLLWSIQ